VFHIFHSCLALQAERNLKIFLLKSSIVIRVKVCKKNLNVQTDGSEMFHNYFIEVQQMENLKPIRH
jgi:hypothetical protein